MQKVDAVADVSGSEEQDREVVVFDSRRSRREAEVTLAATRTAAQPVVAAQPAVVASAAAKPVPARRRPRALRSIVSAAAVTVVAGLVAVASLPAYSFNPEADSQAAADAASALRSVGAQDLTVASTAAIDAAIRDSFSAPTQDELDAAAAQAAALAAAAAAAEAETRNGAATAASGTGSYATVSPRQPGDDYPWRTELTDDQGGGLSPLRYYYRECVDFVAWRLNRDAGSTSAPFTWTWGNLTPGGGSAYAWAGQWASHGWMTSNTPIAGSVAWFNGNHVAYVQAVNADGSVALEEYNWGNDHEYHTRTISAAEVPLFLYPPG